MERPPRGDSLSLEDARKKVHRERRKLEKQVQKTSMIVVLLGAGGDGLSFRQTMASNLSSLGIVGLIPEDDFPKEIGPSLAEPVLAAGRDVDLVFLHVQSHGSSAELGLLQAKHAVARKLRILVPGMYHPLFGNPTSFLSDLYMTHLAALGHVYPVDDGHPITAPSASDLIMKLSQRYQQIKALEPNLIK